MKNRVWLITGCATGFGALLAQAVLDRGEQVAATDKDLSALDHLRTDDPARLLAAELNVADEASVERGIRAVYERFGRIDVLVNNAGLGLGGPFEEVEMAAIRRAFEVNVIGMMAVTRAVLPIMRAGGGGHIINLSSDSGVVGFPFQNVYTATKFAVEGWSECLAHEVFPFNIHLTLIEPCGMFKTGMPSGAIVEAQKRNRPESPYFARVNAIANSMLPAWEHATDPMEVPKAILEVAAMEPPPLRRRVGAADRTGLLSLRRQLPDEEFVQLIRTLTADGASGQRSTAANRPRNGGDLIAKMLQREGVTHLFTIVGGHNYEIVNGCHALGIRVIDVRHEQQAAHMADAFARFTRQTGVFTVDAAPGLSNALAGLQVAHEAQVPVLCLTAQGSLAGRDIGVMQAIDQLRLVRPITKWQRTCFEAQRLPEYTAAALRHARSGRPGPVFLDFPLEVMHAQVQEGEINWPEHYRPTSRPAGDPARIRAALELLSRAKKPLIVAGSGVHWAEGGQALQHFVEATGIPVLTRNLARGLVPDDHPLCVGFMPSGAAGADCYLVLGTRLDWTIGYGRFPLFDLEAKVIHVDIHAEAIGKTRGVDVDIVGDAGMVLQQLNAHASEYVWQVDGSWQARAKGSLKALREGTFASLKIGERDPNGPMHSIQLVLELEKVLKRDAIKVVDGGYLAAYGIQYMDALAPGGVTWVGSTGHLGVGVPYAIAAKLAHPARQVVAVMGDGAFGLCAFEFDTAVRHQLPIVIVIANDEGWGEIRDGQRRRFGEGGMVGSSFGVRRYDEMARALGGYGELVTQRAEVAPALDRAFRSGLPAILNVMMDNDQRGGVVGALPWIVE
jgi:acetolactate synthase-1/2/3 large subunit